MTDRSILTREEFYDVEGLSSTSGETHPVKGNGFLRTAADRLIPLASLSSPIIFNAMIREMAEVSTIIFVGRTGGAVPIGAATLGNMMCNITGFSLAYGLCSALDTLVSQAYGAKLYRLAGLYTQRAAVILTLSSIPVGILWSQTHIILQYGLAIPPDVAALAGSWARLITLGLWPTLMFAVLSKWLQGQHVVWPVVISSIASTVFNIVCNYSFAVLGFGFEGVALTYALTQWFAFLFLTAVILLRKFYLKSKKKSTRNIKSRNFPEHNAAGYSTVHSAYDLDDNSVVGSDCTEQCSTDSEKDDEMEGRTESPRSVDAGDWIESSSGSGSGSGNVDVKKDIKLQKTILNKEFDTHIYEDETDPEDNWPAFSPEVFADWGEFLRLGIPGALSLLLEWGSFELAASIAVRLGTVSLAVHGIYASTASIFYMIPQAVALATATLAGNALGDSRPQDAERVVWDGIYVDFFYGVFGGLVLLLLLRPHWGGLYTQDKDVQDLVYRAMPVMFFYLVVDSTKCVTLNILRSTGRPQITVYGNLVSCLVIMLPLGWCLSVDMSYGLPGLWFAMSTAWLISTAVYLRVVFKTDWKAQIVVKAKPLN